MDTFVYIVHMNNMDDESMDGTGRKRVRWKTKVISGRVSPKTYQAVLDVVDSGSYVDVTDYLRDLIRKDLDERGITLEK